MCRRPWWLFLQTICQVICLCVFRLRVFGQRHVPVDGPVVLACNHQSFLDPILSAVALRREFAFMAREELFAPPGLGWLIRSLNGFPVRRGTADVRAIREALRRLKHGQGLAAYPEGTRSPDGRIHEMEPGLFVIARRAGVPIVPTLILGAHEAWPRHRRFPRPAPIVVAYDAPIPAKQVRRMSPEQCAALVRERLCALTQHYRRLPHLRGRLRAMARAEAQVG